MTVAVLIAAALIAAYMDMRTRRIPNWLTAGMVAYGFIYHSTRAGWSGFLLSLSGFGLGLGLMLIPHLLKGLGAGDVKFLAAVGSIGLIQGVFVVFLGASLVGAIMATLALHRERHAEATGALARGDGRLARPTVSIPYGVALSCGTLILSGLLAM